MCDADLVDIGMTNADDRRQLLATVSSLLSSLHCTRESPCFADMWASVGRTERESTLQYCCQTNYLSHSYST